MPGSSQAGESGYLFMQSIKHRPMPFGKPHRGRRTPTSSSTRKLPTDAHYERIVVAANSQTDDGDAEQSERPGYRVELEALRIKSIEQTTDLAAYLVDMAKAKTLDYSLTGTLLLRRLQNVRRGLTACGGGAIVRLIRGMTHIRSQVILSMIFRPNAKKEVNIASNPC